MCVDIEFTRPQLSNDHINNKSFQITEPYKWCANTNFWPNVKKIQQQKTVGPEKKRNARRAYTNTHIYNSKLGKSSVWFTWDGYKSSMDGANKLLNWEFSDNTHFIIQVSCTVRPIFLRFTSKTIVYACNGSNFVRFIAHLSANEDKNRGSHSTNTLQVHLNSIALVIFLFATSFFFFTFLICLTQLVRNAISFCRQTKMTSPFSVKSLTRDKKCLWFAFNLIIMTS